MDKPKEKPKHAGGRPSKYRVEFCEKLTEHMRNGGSFESFAAVCDATYQTLYAWEKVYPEFLEAKNKGQALSRRFWEEMGKQLATGQIRRVVSEEPMVDATGKPILDAKGNVLYKRSFAPAIGNPAIWIFTMKNMHGWRDKKDIVIEDPPKKTDDEIEARYQELLSKAREEERLRKK